MEQYGRTRSTGIPHSRSIFGTPCFLLRPSATWQDPSLAQSQPSPSKQLSRHWGTNGAPVRLGAGGRRSGWRSWRILLVLTSRRGWMDSGQRYRCDQHFLPLCERQLGPFHVACRTPAPMHLIHTGFLVIDFRSDILRSMETCSTKDPNDRSVARRT